MNEHFISTILSHTGASSLCSKQIIQELWSGYGNILRIGLVNASYKSVVVKHVQLPNQLKHPHGWNTDIGHQRKLKSYQVETNWYNHYSEKSKARLPACIAAETKGNELLLILEDLDIADFSLRKRFLEWEEIDACLAWLANFHASYLNTEPKGLWNVGTYWHLATRPHELQALTDENLKKAAPMIDKKLNDCRFKTLVHGDAKLANFCFSKEGKVAGVDFQYVGSGCGMKDVAYFVGSCLTEVECERLESQILATYFEHLQGALTQKNPTLETEWRSLYRVAWADFHRFIKGWSPNHWKITSYSERITADVIKNL